MIVHDIEQRSPEWYALRAGMPTASEFSKLITSKGEPSKSMKAYAALLAGEMYAECPIDDGFTSAYMYRGREMEVEALRLYEFDRDLDVTPVGFITDDARRYGCSPDALVGDDGMVEIKCLKAENHIKAILRYREHGTAPPDYVQQTQGQILTAERKWCDLVFYHPILPLLTIRQPANDDLKSALKTQLDAVMKERDRVYAELCSFAPKLSEQDALLSTGI